MACRAAALAVLLLAAVVAAAEETPLVGIRLSSTSYSRPGDDLLGRAYDLLSPDFARIITSTIAVRGAPYAFRIAFFSPRLERDEWQPGGPHPREVVFTREWLQSVQCRIEVTDGGDVPFSWWEYRMGNGDLEPSYRVSFEPGRGLQYPIPLPRFDVALSGTVTAPLPVGDHRIACSAVWADGSLVRVEQPLTILANDSADSRALYYFQWGIYCQFPRLGCESESLDHFLAAAAEKTTVPGIYYWACLAAAKRGEYDRAADYLEKYVAALRWNVEHGTPGYRAFEYTANVIPHDRRWFDPEAELKEIEAELERAIAGFRAGERALGMQ
ncbi:MAG: hypothetical protein HYV63_34740 [Candidatus Schekmanbacteria bacterium]|nr:hypothetical protein [Candidatus Schekmanbacteria bacterium]